MPFLQKEHDENLMQKIKSPISLIIDESPDSMSRNVVNVIANC